MRLKKVVMGTNSAEAEVSTKPGVAQVGTNTAETEVGTKAAETQGVGNNMGEEQCPFPGSLIQRPRIYSKVFLQK